MSENKIEASYSAAAMIKLLIVKRALFLAVGLLVLFIVLVVTAPLWVLVLMWVMFDAPLGFSEAFGEVFDSPEPSSIHNVSYVRNGGIKEHHTIIYFEIDPKDLDAILKSEGFKPGSGGGAGGLNSDIESLLNDSLKRLGTEPVFFYKDSGTEDGLSYDGVLLATNSEHTKVFASYVHWQ